VHLTGARLQDTLGSRAVQDPPSRVVRAGQSELTRERLRIDDRIGPIACIPPPKLKPSEQFGSNSPQRTLAAGQLGELQTPWP
jgi:hypothetical protein